VHPADPLGSLNPADVPLIEAEKLSEQAGPSHASSVEASKFLTYVRLVMGTINDPIVTALGIYSLKAAIQGTSTSTVLLGSTSSGRSAGLVVKRPADEDLQRHGPKASPER